MIGKQLDLFKPGGAYVFLTIRERSFVGYNIDAYELTDENITNDDLVPMFYKEETEVINKMRCETWSCNMDWFIVMQDEGIYMFNIHTNKFWLCKKHSSKFIQMFLDHPIETIKKRVKEIKQ